MIRFQPGHNDDAFFIELVATAVNNLATNVHPNEIYVIKIDSWFDVKWRNFQGKLLGAVGSWNSEQLRIPPFIPDRVIEQLYFEYVDGTYESRETSDLHIYQTSGNNITGKRRLVSAGGIRLFIWFSGDSERSKSGSLLVYEINDNTPKTFYISFLRKVNWQIYQTDGLSRNEAMSLIESELVVS